MRHFEDEQTILWTQYKPIQTQLEELRAKFEKVMETFKDIMATRDKEENIRKTAKKELQELNQLAATIQAYWRARYVLKEMKKRENRRKRR